jgi:hypothetical protein
MAKKSNPKPPKTIKVVSDESEVSTPAGESKINKSEEIRVEARRLLDADAKLAPKLIIEKLAALVQHSFCKSGVGLPEASVAS